MSHSISPAAPALAAGTPSLLSRLPMLLGCFCALLLSSGTVIVFSYGVLLKPISTEFGITRTNATLALLLAQLAVAVFVPITGRLVDKYGVRAVLLPSIIAFALAIMSVGLFAQGRASFIALYVVLGIASAGHSPTAYAKVVSSWFIERRGVALGFVMAAIGVGGAVIPPATQWLIAGWGWRGAYVGLGLAVLVFVLPIVMFTVREPQASGTKGALPGASSAEIWRSGDFWRMAITFGLMGFVANGTLTQIPAMLTDRGFAPGAAAGVMAMAGLALIVGRIGAGVLLDWLSGRVVTVLVAVLMLVGIAVLGTTTERSGFILGTVLVGLGLGAEVDLLSYMLAKRFGMRAFGVAHGALISIFAAGSGIGPFAMTASFDYGGGYVNGLMLFGVALLVSTIAIVGVRPRSFEEAQASR